LQLRGSHDHLWKRWHLYFKVEAAMRKEEFYVLELDEEFIVISISDRGAQVVKRGYNSRQEALNAFPQAA
jgi:hypothetical protein